uniref:division/cell wall cluster transcriptional repressor MraZ n=1 Tax=uncultured Draconibacterium sp. TaxID=1573823 RepID=UPI00321788EC
MALFAGIHNATIDDKGRVVLPSAFKKALGVMKVDQVILEKNRLGRCLDIHPIETWEKKVEAFQSKLRPNTNPKHYEMLKKFYRNFTQVGLAANGRINIPGHFLEYADLKDKVTFLGMGASISLSSASTFDNEEISDEDYLDMLREFDE